MTKEQWRASWSKHLKNYLAAFPRTGYHMEMLFPDKSLSILELAGATLRDANYLARRGYQVVGSDYEPETVAAATAAHRNPRLKSIVLDAFDTGLPDNAFDISFHNGLWVCFKSDEDIQRLLREQVRITSGYLVSIVHNAENDRLRELFAEKAETDKLYDIRFFGRDELLDLLTPLGDTRLYAFGTPLSNRIVPSMLLGWLPYSLRKLVFRAICPLEPVRRWERLMAVTRLRKDVSAGPETGQRPPGQDSNDPSRRAA